MKTKRFLSLLGKILGTVLTVVLAVMLVLNIYVAAARNIFGKNNPTVSDFPLPPLSRKYVSRD